MPYTDLGPTLVAGVPVLGNVGGIPLTGNWWFCDYANGSDGNGDSQSGASPQAPLKTITAAYDRCTSGNNDVVVIMGDGATTATQRLESSFTWAKNATHLVGMTAPVGQAQRARISTLTTATTNINPLMTVSGNGCIFQNFSFFQGVGQASTDEKLIDITGDRNYFGNVQFGGMGHAAGAARAGSYIINLSGGDENLFQNCFIGLETIQRSAANASVLLTLGQRNEFRGCVFPVNSSASSPLVLNANTSGALNGSAMYFRECMAYYLRNISGATQPAVLATVHASVNGLILFDRTTHNMAKYAAATNNIMVSGFAIGNGFSSGTFASAADS